MDEEQQSVAATGENLAETERAMTKVFFTQALDRASQRDVLHQKVQELITLDGPLHPKIIHLGQCGWEAVGQVLSPTYFAVTVCRKYNLLPSERSVLLPLCDQYQAIQLCLAKINKKKNGDFAATVSDVLDVWNEIHRNIVTGNDTLNSFTAANDDVDELCLPSSRRESYDPVVREMQEIVRDYQEFLQSSGCIDHFTLYTCLKDNLKSNQKLIEDLRSKVYIIEGVKHMPTMERELIKLLLSDNQVIKLSLVLPLEESSSNDLDMSGITEGKMNTSVIEDTEDKVEMNSSIQEPAGDATPSIVTENLDSTLSDYVEEILHIPSISELSESELFVEQLIVAHLRLLINTRDEMALAALCSMPGREITKQGFHDIKIEAQKKNMPMYQTILSFIMRLRLGGKGYQADPNCPILLHSKPLGEFVDSIMKLQNIVEEEPNARKGAVKVLSQIKSGLMRLRGRAIKGSCIEKVWDCLSSAFTRLSNLCENDDASKESDSTPKIQQTTAALRPCLKLLLQLCDEASGRIPEEIVDVLGENILTQCSSSKKTATPIRIPTVFSLFRSPIDGSPTSNVKKMDEDIEASLMVRLMKSKGLTPAKSVPPRFQSGCSWAPSDLSPVNKGDGIHDKTLSPIVGPTLKAVGSKRNSSQDWKEIIDSVAKQEEQRREYCSPSKDKASKATKKTEEKRSKRSLLSDISNIVPDLNNKKSKSSNTIEKSPGKKKSKTKPIPKGQRSITSFFKV